MNSKNLLLRIFLVCLFFGAISVPATENTSSVPYFLKGAIVPLVTPYTGANAEKVDLEAMARLIDYLCTTPATALFPVSGTGQWDRLTLSEKKDIISASVKAAHGRKSIIAGVGSPKNLEEVLEAARFSELAGVAAIVVVTPEFVRQKQPETNGVRRITDQKLLLNYYRAVCHSVRLPVVVYDPESEIKPATFGKLIDENPNIRSIKVREKHDMGKFKKLVEAAAGRASVLSGSENYALAAMKEGAEGFIGNGLNLYPALGIALVDACKRKDWTEAETLQTKINEANALMEQLGGGAQGIKKILNDVIGVKMETVNRGDTFRPEAHAGDDEKILNYYRKLNLPTYQH